MSGYRDDVGFELSGGIKDVKLMKDASDKTSNSLSYAPIIIQKMDKALDKGYGMYDWSIFTEMTMQ